MDIVYPVNSMYFSTSSTSPASSIGGTWEQIKGAVLAATGNNSFAASAAYGGNLAMTVDQMPSHSHALRIRTSGSEAKGYGLQVKSPAFTNRPMISSDGLTYDTVSTGGGQNFLPYHYSCYIWRRTA